MLYENNLVNSSFSELYHANSSSSGDDSSAYDPLGRITSFSRGTLTASGNNGSTLDTITSANLNSTSGVPNQNSWNLDALGNWTSGNGSSNTFNSQNEETVNGSNTLSYDNAGNMTTDESGNTYVYDAWGHAVSINDGSITRTFEFDALGRNDATNEGEIFTNYYSTQDQLLQQSYGFTYTQYVWGLSYVNDLVLRDRSTTYGTEGDLGITGSGLNEREYDQHNANFSTISYVNQTGSSVGERFAYDPYGAVVTMTGAWVPTSSTSNDDSILFQGMRRIDGNAYLSRTRIYDVNLGRWISQDIRYWEGMSRYAAFDSNPVLLTDPLGLASSPSTKPCVDECEELRKQIMDKAHKLQNKLNDYDPVRDAIGGDTYSAGGKLHVTKGGGTHFDSIIGMQRTLAALIKKYDERCGNDGRKLPPSLRQMPYQKIPLPQYPSAPWWAGGGRSVSNDIDNIAYGFFWLGITAGSFGTAGAIFGGGAAGGTAIAGRIGVSGAVAISSAAAAPAGSCCTSPPGAPSAPPPPPARPPIRVDYPN